MTSICHVKDMDADDKLIINSSAIVVAKVAKKR